MARGISDDQHYKDIAAAIRTKNETDTLYKPSEMAPAILAIQGGVELNFEVVGGTTQPENPKENTIWVNTPNEITGWIFSVDEPTEPADGAVWIRTGKSSNTEFNALKQNSINVYPRLCKQYIDNSWMKKEAMVYRDGEWESFSENILDLITGFTTQRENGTGTITVDNNIVTVTTKGTGSNEQANVIYFSAEKIDISDYTELSFDVEFENNNITSGKIGFFSANSSPYAWENHVATKSFPATNAIDGHYSVDLSETSGSYYFGISLIGFQNETWYAGTNTTIYKNIVLV